MSPDAPTLFDALEPPVPAAGQRVPHAPIVDDVRPAVPDHELPPVDDYEGMWETGDEVGWEPTLPPTPPVAVPEAPARPEWVAPAIDRDALVAHLNPAQRDAVVHRGGALVVVAGPGSGKTRVLTHRIASLVADGVAPWKILAVTFTNKAAGEMRERLSGLLGDGTTDRMWVSTFHSFCVRFLRREHDAAGLPRTFTIYDTDDSNRVLRALLSERGLLSPIASEARKDAAVWVSAISDAKNHGGDWEWAARKHAISGLAEVAAAYASRLAEIGAVDFDDLLLRTRDALRDPDVAERWQHRFVEILVDEYQDTNAVQYEIVRLLAAGHRNLCVVGDQDQCLLPGTLIQTPDGSVPIEAVKEGEAVVATFGKATVAPAAVRVARPGNYTGSVYRVRAEDAEIVGTPHHLVPARFVAIPDKHLVYLMYRADRGYRIGRTMAARKTRQLDPQPGYHVRASGERADALWVLRVCDTFGESSFWEAYYSAQYGIPTACFRAGGRDIAMRDADLEKLFDAIDTRTRGKQLLEDLNFRDDMPHHAPQGWRDRRSVRLCMFGDVRGSRPYHRICWASSDAEVSARAENAGYSVRRAARGPGNKVETSRADYRDALQFAHELAQLTGDRLVREMRINEVTYDLVPISQLHPGMRVLVSSGEDVREVSVTAVEVEDYSGPVYDLEVAGAHNYIAGGLVTHNSIYAWRGATPGVLEGVVDDYQGANVVVLEENYRSTPEIVEVCQSIIAPNAARFRPSLRTSNPSGEPVVAWEAATDRTEARRVCDLIRQRGGSLADHAVLVRANYQTRQFEEAFNAAGTAYQLIGAVKFFDRAEIRDALAWLKLATNPRDVVAFERTCAAPRRGLGDKTIEAVNTAARDRHLPVADAAAALVDDGGLPGRARNALAAWVAAYDAVVAAADDGPVAALEAILGGTVGLAAHWLRDETGEDRVANLSELVSAAAEFAASNTLGADGRRVGELTPAETTVAYLEHVALVSAGDEEAADAVVVMTAHAAKGREFPNVYVVGVEEELFPHARSITASAIDEERRLFYVACSRAMRRLHISWCRERYVFGRPSEPSPSRFLSDLPDSVRFESEPERPRQPQGGRGGWGGGAGGRGGWGGGGGGRSTYPPRRSSSQATAAGRAYPSRPTSAGPSPGRSRTAKPMVAPGPRLDPADAVKGARVRHASFGEGVIEGVVGTFVKVRFDAGVKTLDIAAAPMGPA